MSSDFAEANNVFARRLYAALAENDPGNIILSPASVSMALAMAYAGTNGKTAEELANVLAHEQRDGALHAEYQRAIAALTKHTPGDPELRIANHLWLARDLTIEKTFLQITREHHSAAAEPLDFSGAPEAARIRINQWVSQQTHRKIPELLKAGTITAEARLVLTNAIYFKGAWPKAFDKRATAPGPFRVGSETVVQTPLMHKRLVAPYGTTEDAQVVELDYRSGKGGRQLAMLVVLPKTPGGFTQTEALIKTRGIAAYVSALKYPDSGSYKYSDVFLTLPRYRITWNHDLIPALQSLGLRQIFSPSADFSALTQTERQYLDLVQHEAFIDVNETGTVAAAATAIRSRNLGYGEDVVTFRADHPFIFALRDKKTGLVLFMGRLLQPS